MSGTPSPHDSDDFSHRKRKFDLIRDHLRGDDVDARSEGNEDRLLTLVTGGALPWKSGYHPVGYSEKKGIWRDYFLQAFFTVGSHIVDDDLTEEEVRERLEREREILDEGIGRPAASDGSKGKWRAWHTNCAKSCEWFLGEWSGAEWMENQDGMH